MNEPVASELLLSAKNITKKFGGLAAVNNVSVDLWRNKIHAVIGTNGAGKSTLANLLSGDLAPTSGTVLLNGLNITAWPPEKISKAGLGRSYQKTNIFLPLTVWDNVRLAAQSRAQNPLCWWRPASSFATVNSNAERAPSHLPTRGECKCILLYPKHRYMAGRSRYRSPSMQLVVLGSI